MSNAFWGGLVFLVFGLYMLRHALDSLSLFNESKAWPSVEGTILECRLTLSAHETNLRSLFISYEYKADGSTFVNNMVALYTIVKKTDAEALADRFREGYSVPVYCNPKNSKNSILVTGPPKSKKYSDIILAALGVTVGAFLTVMGYFGYLG